MLLMASNDRRKELFYEAVLKHAVILDFDREMAAMPSEEELSRTLSFSPRHVARMKKLFAAAARRDAMRRVFAATRRVAAFAVVTAGILVGLLMLSPRVRSAVTDTVVEWFDTFVRFGSREQTDTVDFNKGLRPAYIPDGFVESTVVENAEMVMVIYSNGDGDNQITFSYCPVEMHVSVNNEDVTYEEGSVDGPRFSVFAAQIDGKDNIVVWEVEGVRLTLNSSVGVEELLRVALSVRVQK